MSQFRSAMAMARNHGAAGRGTGEFIVERFTALGLILLGVVLGIQLLLLSSGGITLPEARAWIAAPFTAAALLLFVLLAALHAFVCSKVLLEDYVHIAGIKVLLLFLLAALTSAIAVVGTVSILRCLFLLAG